MLAGEGRKKRIDFSHLVLAVQYHSRQLKIYIFKLQHDFWGGESSLSKRKGKKIFLQHNWYFCSEKGRLIESRLPFCPRRVIRYIIMATLENPYCSNLSSIWFEDLQLPPFVPIIISLHFVFHTVEVIKEPTYWKGLNAVRIDGWGEELPL